jgi:hypothetical protein
MTVTVNVDLEWRDACPPSQALYLGSLYVGGILWVHSLEPAPWRAWFMSVDEGEEIGSFANPDDARKAVEKALVTALGGPVSSTT